MFPRDRPRVRNQGAQCALLAFWMLLALPGTAEAHGGIPQSQGLLFDPTDATHLLVPTTFGLLNSYDGGVTWDWVCLQSVPAGRLGFVDPSVISEDGALFLAQRNGLRRSVDDGCSFSLTPPALGGSFVADVTVEEDTGAVLALQSDVATDNQILRSTDEASFSALPGTLPSPFLPERVRVAPSEAGRLYVSGADIGATASAAVWASDDGGTTWTRHPFAFEASELDLFLLEVDPLDASRLFARVRGEVTDRLIVSADGGRTFETVDRLAAAPVPNGRPFGFGRADDGSLYYGNTEAGLLRADGPSLGPWAITALDPTLDVACVVVRGASLYVCGNGLPGGDGFSVGAADLAAPTSFTPVLTFDRIAAPRLCAPPSDVTATCEMWWDDLLRDLGRPVPDGGMPDAGDTGDRDSAAGDASRDSAPPGLAAGGMGGCGCRVGAVGYRSKHSQRRYGRLVGSARLRRAAASGRLRGAFLLGLTLLALGAARWRRSRPRRASFRGAGAPRPRRPPGA